MERNQFDGTAYFKEMAEKNKLVRRNNFVTGYCSGIGALTAMMSEYREAENFVFIDDTTSGNTFSNSVGWFDRSVYCVYILAGYDYNDPKSYNEALNLCRRIFRQMLSRVIKDKEKYKYGTLLNGLNTGNVYSNEFGRYSFNGCTGLFFQIQNDEPTELVYDENEWDA